MSDDPAQVMTEAPALSVWVHVHGKAPFELAPGHAVEGVIEGRAQGSGFERGWILRDPKGPARAIVVLPESLDADFAARGRGTFVQVIRTPEGRCTRDGRFAVLPRKGAKRFKLGRDSIFSRRR